jgi:hypothetical protein
VNLGGLRNGPAETNPSTFVQVGRHATLRTKKKTEQEEEVCECVVMYPSLLSEAGVRSVTLDCYLLSGSQTVIRIERALGQSSAKH